MTSSERRVVYPQFVLFFLLGAAFAAWASRIPAIRDLIGLTPSTLTFALVGRGIGTVLAFPLSAWLVAHYGGKKASFISGTGLLLSIPLLAVAPTWFWLAATLFIAGAVTSSYDVAINALGSASEQRLKVSIMSQLHAWFCVGNFAGALLGSAAAGAEISPLLHFSLSSGTLAVVMILNYRFLPDEHTKTPSGKRFVLPHGGLLMLGAIGFLCAVTESSINSWVALLYTDRFSATPAMAPLGYIVFAGAMLVARLLGDTLKSKFGAWRVLAFGGFLTASGLLIASLTGNIWIATVGFLLAGTGVAVIFPFLFSAAGKEGPSALAAVATMGYSGGILAPPLMGFVVENAGLSMGFLFLAVVASGMTYFALKAKLLR